eukprot:g12460.t1
MRWRPVDILEVMRNSKSPDQLMRRDQDQVGYDAKYDELIPDNPGRLPVRLRRREEPMLMVADACGGMGKGNKVQYYNRS